jgi:D-beta-D-heptose 7-phosphate kinase/D-beta-D-heptose 1-phosphate adenosyltransferase
MSSALLRLIDQFEGTRVVVLGEAMLDSHLYGNASSMCREAPVPIVELNDRTHAPGGAANTAANVTALGGEVSFVSVIGGDEEGRLLERSLLERGVDTTHVLAHPERRTLSKSRLVSDSQILIRFDQGTDSAIDEATEDEVLRRLESLLPGCDVLIVADYSSGLLGPRLIAGVAELRTQFECFTVVDARDLARYRDLRPDAIKPNYQRHR